MPSPVVLAAAPALACVTLALLLWRGEARQSTRDRWRYKPATSALFLAAAFAAGPSDRYDWLVVTGLVLGAIGDVCLIWYLWPFLGALRVPVLGYALAITAMLVGATAVFDSTGADAFRWCVMSGATLFYLSDISVARDRFVPGSGFVNRAIGLPLYYVAQFLLAYSIAL